MIPKHPDPQTVVRQSTRLMQVSFFSVFLFLAFQFASAQDSGATVPQPAPTDAVKMNGQRLRVEGRVSTNQGAARLAWLLARCLFSALGLWLEAQHVSQRRARNSARFSVVQDRCRPSSTGGYQLVDPVEGR